MTAETLEQRVAALEQELARLKTAITGRNAAPLSWCEQIKGKNLLQRAFLPLTLEAE